MRKYNINANIIRVIEILYDKAQSAVLFNGSTGDWFRTTAGVRLGCLLAPTLFNIFLERIMCEALDDHEGSVSIRGRLITMFRFADDIVVNVEEKEKAGVMEDRLDTTTTRYTRLAFKKNLEVILWHFIDYNKTLYTVPAVCLHYHRFLISLICFGNFCCLVVINLRTR